MKAAALLLALLLLPLVHPLFLVGPVKEGRVAVLCEGQAEAFVFGPSGKTERLHLDSSFQAQFTPDAAGPYSVQCGKEVQGISFAGQAGAQSVQPEALGAISFIVLLSSLALIVLMAVAAFAIAKTYLFGGTRFSKTVFGGKAELFLRTDKKMEGVLIEDPVCLGREGPPLSFQIPLAAPGSQWRHEYDFPQGRHALPSELVATSEGKKIRILSELYVGDAASAPDRGKSGAEFAGGKKAARKIAKARS